MKKVFFITFSSILFSMSMIAQSVSINNATPHASAILDVKSNNKGVLLPRTSTTSRVAIVNPAKGLILYDTTTSGFWFHNGTAWAQLSVGGASNYWTTSGSDIYNNNTGNVGIGTNTPAAKIHIKGTANTSQLIIDANATQSNTQPLIRFRDASGVDLLQIHSDNKFNTFIGLNAGQVNTASPGLGVGNTFIGSSAGYSNTTGIYNTAIGQAALFSNTTGKHNTAIGQAALYSNSMGDYNNAFGVKALFSNTTGVHNTATGYNALYSNTGGFDNTANGYQALFSNVDGAANTANGYQSLFSNATGGANTANGYQSLFNNSIGSANTATGVQALHSNTTGIDNTANGYQALYSNTIGNENTANGSKALYLNTGYDNTATGFKALYANINGGQNTTTGAYSLDANTSGNFNTANGFWALHLNTIGGGNTADGNGALFSNTTGSQNTAIGYQALTYNTGGYQNIAIGQNSGTHPNTPNIFNTISIGNDDMLNAYQNQVFIGNTSTGFIGGKVPWSVISDERVKNNIIEDVMGLSFILKLRPVTYHIGNDAITTLTGSKKTPDYPGKYDGEKIKYSGFLAQEVEQAAKAVNYDFSGYAAPKNEWGFYSLSYEQFVVPLVKAVQEQQKIIDKQQRQIDELKKDEDYLQKQMNELNVKLEKLVSK